MNPGSAKRILIAPLDWGLGHTTRCIPIIRRLLELKCEVIFTGNDDQQTFVTALFPGLRCLELPGYNVRYGRGALLPALFRQLPRIFSSVAREHAWLHALVAAGSIDAVISDNRYGLWHTEIPCVILTHQAEIKTGFGRLADDLLRRIHYKFLRRFGECWIVDTAGKINLGGTLSHPASPLPGARYIGWISQFSAPQNPVIEKHLLVLLSGPEPQRGLLSDLLWAQACDINIPVVFVEGSASAFRNEVPAHITHHARVSGGQLQGLLEEASLVICRSGYSTLMDLMLLRKKAILIPTPGQTEQEYLAQSLAARGLFLAARQKGFSLSRMLEASSQFRPDLPDTAGMHEAFIPVVDDWVSRIPVRVTQALP